MSRRQTPQAASVRLLAVGTRVVVLRGAPAARLAGVVSEVRLEPHLRTYVVTCDDGARTYASGYELAREDDASATPLGLRPEYE